MGVGNLEILPNLQLFLLEDSPAGKNSNVTRLAPTSIDIGQFWLPTARFKLIVQIGISLGLMIFFTLSSIV